jgi:hypothetical protein
MVLVLAEPADHIWRTPMLVPRPIWTSVDALETIFDSDPADWGGELLSTERACHLFDS